MILLCSRSSPTGVGAALSIITTTLSVRRLRALGINNPAASIAPSNEIRDYAFHHTEHATT
ncbi:hypothetical protein AB5J62_24630 [Amycolatopsis sp. cg5]|uniref:hypothetical protein n=1 Tax=Amycolatopsis sp. cg5 TaxID=3238802 RepID=UPI003526B402